MLKPTSYPRIVTRLLHSTLEKRHLAIAIVMSVLLMELTAAPGLAQVETTAVTGYGNLFGGPQLNDPDGGSFHLDAVGNLHRRQLKAKGTFELMGDGLEDIGTLTVWITGLKDSNGDGATYAPVLLESTDGAPLWKGNMNGHFDDHYFSGDLIMHGQGPYEGLTAELDVQEICRFNPDCTNPSEYALSGTVFDRSGN